MPAGRPRKPTSLKILEGNRAKGRKPSLDNEPQPDRIIGVPKAPPYLGRDAKREWKRIFETCRDANGCWLSCADLGFVEGACVAYGRAVEADLVLKEEGFTVTSKNQGGNVYKTHHPAFSISKDSWKQYRDACGQLGMSPAARAKLNVGGAKQGDDLESALAS